MDEIAGDIEVMENSFEQLWDVQFGPLLTAALVALVLAFSLWVFSNYLLPVFTRDLAPKRVARFRQRVSVGAWSVYFTLLLYLTLKANPLVIGPLLLVLLAAGWNFWRDLVEGAIFKLQARVAVGDRIVVHEQEGVIEKIGMRHLSVRTLEDRTLYVPYRELGKDAWQKAGQRSKLKSRSFELQLAQGHTAHADDILKTVEQCPWTVVGRAPEVSTTAKGLFHIEATTLDQQTFEYLVEYLNKRFA